MKKIKIALCCVLVFIMIMPLTGMAYTMYSLDGRKIDVDYNEAQMWRNVGWYDAPVTEMYALDGRTVIVYQTEIQNWKDVGWYTEPAWKLYAAYNGNYSGGGMLAPGCEYPIGQWGALISNAGPYSINLKFGQSESDYYIKDMILYRQENGSYYGVGNSSWGTSCITVWLESPQRILLTVSGKASQLGTEYLYKN